MGIIYLFNPAPQRAGTLDNIPAIVYTPDMLKEGEMTTHTHPEIEAQILELSEATTSEIGDSEKRLRADMYTIRDELKSDIAGLQSDIAGLQPDIARLQSDMRLIITWIKRQGG